MHFRMAQVFAIGEHRLAGPTRRADRRCGRESLLLIIRHASMWPEINDIPDELVAAERCCKPKPQPEGQAEEGGLVSAYDLKADGHRGESYLGAL